MKLIKEIINKTDPILAETIIQSNSVEDLKYKISLRKSGRVEHEPDCVASSYGRECSHIKKAKEIFKERGIL